MICSMYIATVDKCTNILMFFIIFFMNVSFLFIDMHFMYVHLLILGKPGNAFTEKTAR